MKINNTDLIINQLPDCFSLSGQTGKIKKLLSRLPNSTNGIFEFDLIKKQSPIDYSQAIGKTDEEKQEFINFVDNQMKRASKNEQPIGEQLFTFANLWIQGNHLYHKLIPNIWLEFDNCNISLPSVYFTLRKKTTRNEQLLLAESILSLFDYRETMEPALEKIAQCIQYDDAEFPFIQLGLMFPRYDKPVKLVVGPIQINKATDLINYLNTKEGIPIPSSFYQDFQNHFVNLSFDINNLSRNAFGLEFIVFEKDNAEHILSDIENYLVRNNYTTHSNFNEILNWEASIRPAQTEQFWPDSILLDSLSGREFNFPKLEFYVNHFKFCFLNSEISNVKCYLYYRFTKRTQI